MERVWAGGRLRAPFIVEKPEPHRPDIVIWLDLGRDFILDMQVIEPSDPPDALAESLRRAIGDNDGLPPDVVRVGRDSDAVALEGRLAPGVRIEVAPTPELNGVLKSLERKMEAESEPPPTYLQGGRIPAALVSDLFREAAALWRAKPWNQFDDDSAIALTVPALGIEDACITVIGGLGKSYGMLIFGSREDFQDFLDIAEEAERGGHRPAELGVPFITLGFERGADVPDSMRREISVHRWPVAGASAYPVMWAIETDGRPRPLQERDVRLALAASIGVRALVRTWRSGTDPGPLTVPVKGPEPMEVSVRLPGPDPGLTEEARAQVGREVDALIERFATNRAGPDRPADWDADARFIAGALLDFKLDYVDGRMSGLAAGIIEDFLLDYFPRKVGAEALTVSRAPEILDAFLAWLAETGVEPAARMDRARRRLDRVRDEFLELASDPAQFGPAKQIIMAMQKAGVDINDPAAVSAFIEDYNRSLPGGKTRSRARATRRPPPSPKPAPGEPPRPGADDHARWLPAPDEAPPVPDAPCPCGSGKRYKRCCMPR
jgi:hypothetical protein